MVKTCRPAPSTAASYGAPHTPLHPDHPVAPQCLFLRTTCFAQALGIAAEHSLPLNAQHPHLRSEWDRALESWGSLHPQAVTLTEQKDLGMGTTPAPLGPCWAPNSRKILFHFLRLQYERLDESHPRAVPLLPRQVAQNSLYAGERLRNARCDRQILLWLHLSVLPHG